MMIGTEAIETNIETNTETIIGTSTGMITTDIGTAATGTNNIAMNIRPCALW